MLALNASLSLQVPPEIFLSGDFGNSVDSKLETCWCMLSNSFTTSSQVCRMSASTILRFPALTLEANPSENVHRISSVTTILSWEAGMFCFISSILSLLMTSPNENSNFSNMSANIFSL